MNFGKIINEYKNDILKDLKALLEIKSVSSNNKEECQKALAFVLKRAEEMGFETKNIDTDDLISIGTIGLLKGIDTYKENKSTKITTYAARCIQNATIT